MSWIDIFRPNKYQDALIGELKRNNTNLEQNSILLNEKILVLETQIILLTNKINSTDVEVKEQTNTKRKLSPKEKLFYEKYKNLTEPVTQIELSNITNTPLPSLRTMISRCRKKGYTLNFI
jgi:hypothetical protein